VDRETLVKLLAAREDLSSEQVNQIIDQVQEAIRALLKPRRLAKRATKQVVDFEQIWKATCVTPTKNSTKRSSEICNYCSMIHAPGWGI